MRMISSTATIAFISTSANATITIRRTAITNTGANGSGSAFSILPPYIVKYCWERTA